MVSRILINFLKGHLDDSISNGVLFPKLVILFSKELAIRSFYVKDLGLSKMIFKLFLMIFKPFKSRLY